MPITLADDLEVSDSVRGTTKANWRVEKWTVKYKFRKTFIVQNFVSDFTLNTISGEN